MKLLQHIPVPMAHRIAAVVLVALTLGACDQTEPDTEGSAPAMRRLSNQQYRNVIADVFGAHITVAGEADSLLRTDGLLALGARTVRITPSGFEKFYDMARSVAQQVVNTDNRSSQFRCEPASASEPDDACAQQFFSGVGRLLYRRPLTAEELLIPVSAARDGATSKGDFYHGIALGLAGMMTSPQFLFVIDMTEPDPADPDKRRLTAFAKVTRLSFLLWNTTPNEVLLRAAERGELDTEEGINAQAERMMASHRLEVGMRAFFMDFLRFEEFETLEKDSIIYPAFTVQVIEDAKEQMLLTIVDLLMENQGDYRDLFTTRKTFITGPLARIYRVPTSRPSGNAWIPYEFSENDPRAGLLMQVGFAALASHPGRSSPTLRGMAIREALLCQQIPNPPGNVDFSQFEDPDSPNPTAKDRLAAHSTEPACAGCHKIMDPIGLGLEQLDGMAQFRATENGAVIDASGDLDGVTFKDGAGLGQAMWRNPATTACLVNRLTEYAMGRPTAAGDRDYIAYLEREFAEQGYRLPGLLRRIATSRAFYAVAVPKLERDADTEL
ncbi:MAG: DUF1592 domain-containing protein [Gammaproteobacteria bacterium]